MAKIEVETNDSYVRQPRVFIAPMSAADVIQELMGSLTSDDSWIQFKDGESATYLIPTSTINAIRVAEDND